MKEYNFHTIQSFLADIPAYIAIFWVKFASLVFMPSYPRWEQWLFDHGWLILLTLRIASIIWDLRLKFEIEEGGVKLEKPEGKDQKKSTFGIIIHKLIKFFLR